MFRPKLFAILKHRKKELPPKQLVKEVFSGLLVAILALPLSIALGIASGVSPEKGLMTAVVAGFFISFLGGSRVQIGGPTGAFVVIVYGVVHQYGIEGLVVATILAGLMLILFGVLKLGNVIQFIPYPITTGFTSGIAVVLFSTQIKDFFGLNIKDVPSEFLHKWIVYLQNFASINWVTVGIGLLAVSILVLWPKVNRSIPASLMALVVTTCLVQFLKLPVSTIGSVYGNVGFHPSFPQFSILSLDKIMILMKPAFSIAVLAGVESLLSAVVADGMIGKKHHSNTELIAQGVANIASGLVGGIPATGAIARTAANVKNGGRTPISGMVHALSLAIILLFFMPYATLIPMVSLAAILMAVAYNMSEWRTFVSLMKSPKSDIAVLLITFFLTVFLDLVVAIGFGMVFALFLFVKKLSEQVQIKEVDIDEELEADAEQKLHERGLDMVSVYEIQGPLFFASINTFIDAMNEIHQKMDILILDLHEVPVLDATGLQALKKVVLRCRKQKKLVFFLYVQKQPYKSMLKEGFVHLIGKDRFFNDLGEAMKEAEDILIIRYQNLLKRGKTIA